MNEIRAWMHNTCLSQWLREDGGEKLRKEEEGRAVSTWSAPGRCTVVKVYARGARTLLAIRLFIRSGREFCKYWIY